MKEYAVHFKNRFGDEYITGHYKTIEEAQAKIKERKEIGTFKQLYILEREVSEWQKVKK